MSSEDMGYGN